MSYRKYYQLCGSSDLEKMYEEHRKAHEEFIASELCARLNEGFSVDSAQHKRPRTKAISPTAKVKVHIWEDFVVMTYEEYQKRCKDFKMEVL